MKAFFTEKTIKIYNLVIIFDFSMHKSINFSHILPDNKKTNTVTPQFYLSFSKDIPNTTK